MSHISVCHLQMSNKALWHPLPTSGRASISVLTRNRNKRQVVPTPQSNPQLGPSVNQPPHDAPLSAPDALLPPLLPFEPVCPPTALRRSSC